MKSNKSRTVFASALLAMLFTGALSACGGDDTAEPPTPLPNVSEDFAGEWFGPTTYSIEGLGTLQANGRLSVSLIHEKAFASRICPDGAGEIVPVATSPDQTVLKWTGNFRCGPVAFSDCSSVVPTYTSATLTTYGPTRLVVNAGGFASGCGTTRAFEAHFDGGR